MADDETQGPLGKALGAVDRAIDRMAVATVNGMGRLIGNEGSYGPNAGKEGKADAREWYYGAPGKKEFSNSRVIPGSWADEAGQEVSGVQGPGMRDLGTSGDDRMTKRNGRDKFGGPGDDFLVESGWRASELNGGPGDDVLLGTGREEGKVNRFLSGEEEDVRVMVGGEGKDTFRFDLEGAKYVIEDYQPGERIELGTIGGCDVTHRYSEADGGLVLKAEATFPETGSNEIVLQGITHISQVEVFDAKGVQMYPEPEGEVTEAQMEAMCERLEEARAEIQAEFDGESKTPGAGGCKAPSGGRGV